MKKLLALLAIIALSISGSASATWPTIAEGWHKIEDPATTYANIPAPAGCIPGSVPVFNASTDIDCNAYLNYTAATRTLEITGGTLKASNITATALATPGAITVTPVLTQIGSITTIAAGWRANGLLTVVPGANLLDGETFVVSDGTHVPQSFEFDVANDGVLGGHVEVTIAGTETASDVGALCAAAINATTGAGFTVTAIDNLDGTVVLRNTLWAASGNSANSTTVADAGFTITNMAGGVDAGVIDGDYFTIKYSGAGTIPIEFDTGDGTTGGRIPLIFDGTDTADTLRDKIITLINTAAPLAITASNGGAATVSLELDTPGATGLANTENVAAVGFAVTGMADPTHATTVTYKLVAVLADGTTTEAGAASTTNLSTATLSAKNYLHLTWAAVPNAFSYKIYRTVAPTSPATTGIINTVSGLGLFDNGLAGGGETAPSANGTGVLTGKSLTLDAGSLTYDAATDTLTVTGQVSTAKLYDNTGSTWRMGYGGQLSFKDAGWIKWSSTGVVYDNVPDLGLARASAGVLKVTDGGAGAGGILVGDGTAAAPSVAFASQPTLGFYFKSSGIMGLVGSSGLNSRLEFLEAASSIVLRGYAANVEKYQLGPSTLIFNGDAFIRSDAAATLQLGAAASATPVAQTLQAQGGAGTDIPGANLTIQSGAGTGAGTPSAITFSTPTAGGSGAGVQTQSPRMVINGSSDIYVGLPFRPGASDTFALGTSANLWRDAYLSRATLGSKSKALTDASATAFATFTIADGAQWSGEIIYSVRSVDGTNLQIRKGRAQFTASREGTNYDADIAEIGTSTVSAKTGTLTGALEIGCAAGVCKLSANFDSSQTTPVLTGAFRFDSTDAGLALTFP